MVLCDRRQPKLLLSADHVAPPPRLIMVAVHDAYPLRVSMGLRILSHVKEEVEKKSAAGSSKHLYNTGYCSNSSFLYLHIALTLDITLTLALST